MTTDVAHAPSWIRSTRARAPQTNVRAVFFALMASFFLSTATVAIGLIAGVRGGDIACLLLAALQIMIALIPLSLDVGRPPEHRHVFLSLLSISYIVNFSMPVFTHYIPAVGPIDPAAMAYTNLMPGDVARGQALAIMGLLTFYIGYAIPVGPLLRPVLPTRLAEWRPSTALVATTGLILIGWLVFIGRAVGAIPAALGSGWIGGFSGATLYGSALLTATYLKYRSRAGLLLLATLVPLTSAVMFTTGSKSAVLMPFAMIVLTWFVVQRRVRVQWIVGGIIAVALLYPVAQFWREDVLQHNTLTMVDVARNPGPALRKTAHFLATAPPGDYLTVGLKAAGVRLDAIGVASVIARDTPAVSPFQNGRTILLVPIGFVPRLLWPSKPQIHIGDWVSKTYTPYGYLTDSSLSVSWIGEFYMNFGVTGVVLGMAVLGFLLRCVQTSLIRDVLTIPLIAAAATVLRELLLGVQGSLTSVINASVIALIPLFLVHLLVRAFGGTYPVSAFREADAADRPQRSGSSSQ